MRRNISPKRLELPESSNLLNLKKYIVYLALLIPIAGNAQFEISYNPNTNTMSVNYTGCEMCLLGVSSAVSACQCNSDCKETTKPSDEQLERNERCIRRCDANYGDDDPYVYDACLDGCERHLEGRITEECRRRCGDPIPVRTIVGYRYRLIAAWAPVDQDPRQEMDNWTRRPLTALITGDWVNIPDWNPPSPWPEIYAGNNRCWGIGIIIIYEEPDGDRGFCEFSIWECEFIG